MVFRIYVRTNSESISGISVDHKRITEKVKITDAELQSWKSIGCYVLSFSEEHNVYLQQDGFLDKEFA
jgi:maltose phosphorylase